MTAIAAGGLPEDRAKMVSLDDAAIAAQVNAAGRVGQGGKKLDYIFWLKRHKVLYWVGDRMGWKAFIANLVSSLAWPAVVAYLLWLLRNQLADLANRLDELTLPGGAKAKFVKALADAKAEAETLPPEEAEPPPTEPEIVRLAEIAPDAAIQVTFKEIEDLLTQLRDKLALPPRSNLPAIMSQLLERKLVSNALAEIFNRLRLARNEAVHLRKGITYEEALAYVEQAGPLKNALQKILAQ